MSSDMTEASDQTDRNIFFNYSLFFGHELNTEIAQYEITRHHTEYR